MSSVIVPVMIILGFAGGYGLQFWLMDYALKVQVANFTALYEALTEEEEDVPNT